MVVRAHVEAGVVVVVEPADVFATVRYGGRILGSRFDRIRSFPAPDLGHHPGARDDGMRLQELLRSRALHLRGNDAQQVVLHPDSVDRRDLVALHDKTQRAGEFLHLLALPVEIHADCDVVQDERRFGEEGGGRHGVEHQFVVQHPVVVDAAAGVLDELRAGAVGDDFETDLLGGHDAHVERTLGAGETPDDPLFGVGRHADFLQHLFQDARIQAVEFVRDRTYEEARDVGTADAHRKVLVPRRIEMVGPQLAAEDDQRAVFAGGAPGQEVEAGFLLTGKDGRAVQEAVEELGGRLGGLGADQEDAARKFLIVKESRILHVGQVAQGVFLVPHIPLHGGFQGQQARRTSLEMHVVGLGGAAHGAVVKDGIAAQVAGQVEHVHEAAPDGLVHVAVAGDDQVVRKNGIRVDLDAVQAPFPAFETQVALLRGAVFLAEEAALGREDLVGIAGQRGLDAGRVALRLDGNAADLQLLDTRRLEGAEMVRGQRPYRQLVRQELLDREGAHITAGLGGLVGSVGIPVRNWESGCACRRRRGSPLPSSSGLPPPRR